MSLTITPMTILYIALEIGIVLFVAIGSIRLIKKVIFTVATIAFVVVGVSGLVKAILMII